MQPSLAFQDIVYHRQVFRGWYVCQTFGVLFIYWLKVLFNKQYLHQYAKCYYRRNLCLSLETWQWPRKGHLWDGRTSYRHRRKQLDETFNWINCGIVYAILLSSHWTIMPSVHLSSVNLLCATTNSLSWVQLLKCVNKEK